MAPPSMPETKQSVEKRLAWAAGADRLQQHDALYYVTESFHQSFDRMGRAYAQASGAGFREEGEKKGPETEKRERGQKQNGPKEDETADYQPESRSDRLADALTCFSRVTFQRGAMSAAVLNGTGKMMLVSCLRRTREEIEPRRLEQSRAGTGGTARQISGHAPDQVIFNRSFAGRALGIVVDTLRDARRVVESMAVMADDTGEQSEQNRGALFRLYPFLDDSRDRALEAEYRERLACCTESREKPILQNALVQTVSLRAKKAQMKNEFINKLRFLSDRAAQTLSELEAPGILDELTASAFGEREFDLPENPDEGAGEGAPNRKKNRSGQAERTESTADEAKSES